MPSTVDEQDLHLARRAVAGDVVALQQLLLRHRGDLYRYIRRLLPEDLRRVVGPDDIVQDVWVRCFRRAGHLPAATAKAPLRWLLRMAHNQLVHLIREHRCRKRGRGKIVGSTAAWPHESIVLLLADLAVYERTPSQSAVAHELLANVQQSVSLLPAQYQEALRLHYMDGMEVQDVAARMGQTQRATANLCHRALYALRKALRTVSFSP